MARQTRRSRAAAADEHAADEHAAADGAGEEPQEPQEQQIKDEDADMLVPGRRRTRRTVQSAAGDADAHHASHHNNDDDDFDDEPLVKKRRVRVRQTPNANGQDGDDTENGLAAQPHAPPKRQRATRSAAKPSRPTAKAATITIDDSDDEYSFHRGSSTNASSTRGATLRQHGNANDPDIDDDEDDVAGFGMQIVASYADLFVDQDYQGLRLKDDHKVRPLWVCSNGRIILEAFSILFDQAQDFLTAIAEPLSRPEHVHEYRLTEYSLYAAVSVGLSTESIIAVLELLSKSEVSDELQAFIRQHTSSYGKIKVVLRENRYWLETKDETVRQMLTGDAVIAASVVHVDHLQQEQQQQQQQQHVPGGFDLGVDGLAQGLGTGFGSGGGGGGGGFLLDDDDDMYGFEEQPGWDDEMAAMAAMEEQMAAQDRLAHAAMSGNPGPSAPGAVAEAAVNMGGDADAQAHAAALLEGLDLIDLFEDDYLIMEQPQTALPATAVPHAPIAPSTQTTPRPAPSQQSQQPPPAAQRPRHEIQDLAPDLPAETSPASVDKPAVAKHQSSTDQNDGEPDKEADAATSAAAPLAARYQELLQQQEELGAVAWRTRSLEIAKSQIEDVKRRCADLSLPALEEYDFRADKINPDLKIDLKSTTKLRPYQERSLGKLFSNGRARSGVIVLPCGAGKTLVGVTAACTIKKSCLVLCTSSVSVEQWAREFRFWSSSQDGQVARFTSDTKEKFNGSAGIMISTYTMVTYSGKRAYDAQQLMDFIQSREWGLLLLDEVHVVPADMFRKVFTIVAAHAKLGLTATLVREDNKIENLNYLIGPKLYEANWMELAKSGHIANVQCAEVWCTMTPEFYREYLREKSRKRQLLYTMNPRKVQACQYLISFHEAMGDKIIVFSDNVFALKHYATTLNKPFIYGGTSQSERIRVLQQFRFNPALNTIFISKVGDTSIDLPEATCLIQISSHYGSRRQEAQRLGRILRAKKGADAGFNAFFYSLVSRDTEEMYYATKRQQFLVDQGYNFRIITNIEGMDSIEGLAYANLKEQLELLNTVLISSEADYDEEADDQDADAYGFTYRRPAAIAASAPTALSRPGARAGNRAYGGDGDTESILGGGSSSSSGWMKRSSGSTLQSLSGADSMAYLEFNRGTSSGMAKSRNAHAATGSGSGSGP